MARSGCGQRAGIHREIAGWLGKRGRRARREIERGRKTTVVHCARAAEGSTDFDPR